MTKITRENIRSRTVKAGEFVWSNYWQTWSKVLAVKGFDVVELSICGMGFGEIRQHCTPLHYGDEVLQELPKEVRDEMVTAMGEEKADFLIDYPLMKDRPSKGLRHLYPSH